MYTLEEVTKALKRDRKTLVDNLNTKEVVASEDETFTSLAAKVLDIKSGGADLSEYFYDTVTTAPTQYANIITQSLKKLPMIDTSNLTSFRYAFSNSKVENIPLLDTSNCTSFDWAFNGANCIKEIPLLDTSKGEDFSYMFVNASLLENVPQLDVGNGTNFSYMFKGCGSLKKVPSLNTVKGTNFNYMFELCTKLEELGMLDMSSAISIRYFLMSSNYLTKVGGFKDVGKAYDASMSANYYTYTLDVYAAQYLTHESAMNIINNLYDIATKGCKPQTLRFHANVMALLSEGEVAIGTNKGWTITTDS